MGSAPWRVTRSIVFKAMQDRPSEKQRSAGDDCDEQNHPGSFGFECHTIVIALRAQFHLILLIAPSRISQIRKMEDHDSRKVDRHVFMIACVALALIATWTAWIMSDYCVLGLGKGCRLL